MGKCLLKLRRLLPGFIRKHWGRALYYGGVALALTAIAFAAEAYRTEQPQSNALILPAVELDFVTEEPQLVLPDQGEILRGYAPLPEWSESLNQWEAHAAVDYALAEDAVYSLSAGTVRTVGKSGIYGGFVEVETEEFLLRYASIAPDEGLIPGMQLEAGEAIGLADDSMPGEASLGAHLHLELDRMGALVNFTAHAQKKPAVD